MKKIGIVTYAHCENFGAELQACALCRAICQVSHEKARVEVVWFERAPLSAREQRVIFDDADMSLADLGPIDYDTTYLRLDELRRSSWRFLHEAING